MAELEPNPEPIPPQPNQTDVPLEERGIDLGQAALDAAGAFIGGTGANLVAPWISSKLNPPPRGCRVRRGTSATADPDVIVTQ